MVQVTCIEPFKNPREVAAIVSIYQQSFGNEPWNEGYKCPVCEHVIPLGSSNEICEVCRMQGDLIPMLPYWPTERVLRDFYREMGKKDAVCLVARTQEIVVGFAWGYEIGMDESTSAHLGAPDLHLVRSGTFPYLDEVAVCSSHRRKGIGELLTRAFVSHYANGTVILRTLSESPMFQLVRKMRGSVLCNISRNRVIAEIPNMTSFK